MHILLLHPLLLLMAETCHIDTATVPPATATAQERSILFIKFKRTFIWTRNPLGTRSSHTTKSFPVKFMPSMNSWINVRWHATPFLAFKVMRNEKQNKEWTQNYLQSKCSQNHWLLGMNGYWKDRKIKQRGTELHVDLEKVCSRGRNRSSRSLDKLAGAQGHCFGHNLTQAICSLLYHSLPSKRAVC